MRVGAVPGPLLRASLCVGALVVALAASSASRAAAPSIYFHYAPDCSFRIVDDGGAAVTTVPPGSYQVVVDTPYAFAAETAACSFVQFNLSGPGVSHATTLGTGDSEIELFSVTLQPSSTYVAQDDGAPARTRRTFTTAASGSPASVAAAGGGSTASSGSKTGSSKGSTSAIGTAIPTEQGTLVGTVGANGKLTLTRKGKAVQILPAGRYDFS